MANKTKKVTSIVEVAKRAGVSVATVSRVLNDSSLVKPETKEQIRKVADQLGYALPVCRPGPKPGRPVRKKKIAFLGFVDGNHYPAGGEMQSTFLALQRGVEEAGEEYGLSIKLHLIATEAALSETIENGDFFGFILQGWKPHSSVKNFLKTKPCCWVMNNSWTPDWGDHIMPDHREVGMMAAEYLIDHGCRKPVSIWLGCPDRISTLRKEGFLYAAGKQGVESRLVFAESSSSDVRVAYPAAVYVNEIVERLHQADFPPDGIFFDSDYSMAALYPVMVREKIIIPGKTVLISCNNQQPFLKGIKPHPATMDVHFEQIGRIGVSQLVWRMKNPDCQRVRSLISPSLISLS
jgi:LacI family transcriptional regulator